MSSNKHFWRVATAAALIASVSAPLAALAQTTNTNGANRKPATGFCARTSELSSIVTGRNDELKNKLDAKRVERDKKLVEKRTSQEAKMDEYRAKADAKRDEVVAKIREKAGTGEQKAAVESFQATVRAAVGARRAAIKTANETFSQGVNDAIAKRKAAADAATKTFKDAVLAAVNKAKADCAAGIDQAMARTTYMAGVNAAKTKLKTDLKAVEKTGDSVKPLIEVRRAGHDKAAADFKAAMEKARTDLKAAFPEKPATNTNE